MSMPPEEIKSTCSYCGVGCGVVVKRDGAGRLTLKGDPDHPVNRGMLCSKGMNLHYTVGDHSDRLFYPEMRAHRALPRARVEWKTAMERAAAVFKGLIKKYGPDSVGFYVSGQLLTEEYYLVNKLTKGFIKTANIDTNSRLCMSSAVVGYKKALGEDSVPIAYEDLELADCYLIAGANPAWCHPILFRRIEKHREQNPDVKMIVVDPRRTETCEDADLHLRIKPGTDVTLYNALARLLIENGDIDQEFIKKHANGFDELREIAFVRTPGEAAEVCGVPEEDIRRAAAWIGSAKGFLTLWAMGLNQSAMGVRKNLALINLNLITGQIGKPGSGPFSLTGQPNAMGGREVGGLSNMLAAHRDLTNPEHREEVERYWNVSGIPDKPGLSAVEMFDALREGRMKAVWIICTNPMVSLPDSNRVREALQNARFVVVQDVSRNSETMDYADLVLPAAGWLEKEGTMTNSERRITRVAPLVDAPGEALPDAEILMRFARAMGYSGFDFETPADVYREHVGLTAGTNLDVSGLDYEILKRKGSIQWPVPSPDHEGTPRLFADGRFFTADGRANIHGCDDNSASEPVDGDFPLILTTGRIRDQWHTMTRTGKVNRLKGHIAEPYLEIHPVDAEARDIREGELVDVESRRGVIRLRARVSDAIRPGVIFAPMHWGGKLGGELARANNVTNPLFDPISKEPDFKFAAVNARKVSGPPRRIVVVGAGFAALAFIREYRRDNQLDEIIVLSGEKTPFYNRILLPDYVRGEKSRASLELAPPADLEEMNVLVHADTRVQRIDRERKSLFDEDEREYPYDVLVLATGAVPRPLPAASEGAADVYTLRTTADADLIRKNIEEHAVIVGGGLLGIELAGALREMGLKVTIIQRSSRLMSRRLDGAASELLAEMLREKGIRILFNDEVASIGGHAGARNVYTAGGAIIECDGIVAALGTVPAADLPREAGLPCNYGVIVDDLMRTADQHILAIGELAEYEHVTRGITLAAEEMAAAAARGLAGDPVARYRPSMDLNILKCEGIELAGMGKIQKTHDDEEEIVYLDRARRVYKKVIIRDDRLVGCILLGDVRELERFRELHENDLELAEERDKLILAELKREPMRGELVCSCRSVGTENIRAAFARGECDMAAVQACTGAGSGCGSCRPEIARILRQCDEAGSDETGSNETGTGESIAAEAGRSA